MDFDISMKANNALKLDRLFCAAMADLIQN
jgi:hypothetical protein